MIFSNGGTNLHFLQNAQRCQEGIIQFLNLGYIKIKKCNKTLYGPQCKLIACFPRLFFDKGAIHIISPNYKT